MGDVLSRITELIANESDWRGPRVLVLLGALSVGSWAGPGCFAPPAAAQAPVKVPGWPASVRAELFYVGDVFAPTTGGLSREAVYLDNLDLMLDLDLEALLKLSKTSLRVHVQSNRGSSASERVGDFQGLSNIEAPSEWRLYEAWVEHNLLPGRLSVLAGVYDLNAEFDVIRVAGDFLNSSFGFGPDFSSTGISGPSTFPLTTLGVRVTLRPYPSIYGRLAVMDGSPGDPADPDRSRFALGNGEGALIAWEVGYNQAAPGVMVIKDEPPTRVQEGGRRIGRSRTVQRARMKLSLGGWAYTRDFDAWEVGEPAQKSWGVYALGERLLYVEPGDAGSLSAFVRAGTANADVNRLSAYLGGGLVYAGLIPGRTDDVLGFAVAHARNGSPFLRAFEGAGERFERAETVLEGIYLAQLGEFFQLEPNLQWIVNPGMDPAVENALVLGLRGRASLNLP